MNTKPSGLVHLARTPAEVKKQNVPAAPANDVSGQSAYPYGLELSLGPDETSKLGMTSPPTVGSTVHATVQMHVGSASSEPTVGGGAKHRISLTVTHMKIHPPGHGAPAKVSRVPSATPKPKAGHVAVAAHVRRVAAPKPRASRSAYVRPPTVKRAR